MVATGPQKRFLGSDRGKEVVPIKSECGENPASLGGGWIPQTERGKKESQKQD